MSIVDTLAALWRLPQLAERVAELERVTGNLDQRVDDDSAIVRELYTGKPPRARSGGAS